jgi:chemotaxis response regulator CheB
VVFGMPKEAVRRGAVEVVLPLYEIAGEVVRRTAAGAVHRLRSCDVTL